MSCIRAYMNGTPYSASNASEYFTNFLRISKNVSSFFVFFAASFFWLLMMIIFLSERNSPSLRTTTVIFKLYVHPWAPSASGYYNINFPMKALRCSPSTVPSALDASRTLQSFYTTVISESFFPWDLNGVADFCPREYSMPW